MLGTARFLTTTMGISLTDLVEDRDGGIQFSCQGEETTLKDIVRETAPRRVFLLLGLNDLASDNDFLSLPPFSHHCARFAPFSFWFWFWDA